MTNDIPPGGEDKRPASLPPGLRQALEQIFSKYITPLRDEVRTLAASLKSDDAREVAALRESLRECNRELEALKYAHKDEQTNARMARKNAEMWEERNDKKAGEIADLQFRIGALQSIIDNRTSGTDV